jgi:hypothetical protein
MLNSEAERRAVELVPSDPEWVQKSDRWIAKVCKVRALRRNRGRWKSLPLPRLQPHRDQRHPGASAHRLTQDATELGRFKGSLEDSAATPPLTHPALRGGGCSWAMGGRGLRRGLRTPGCLGRGGSSGGPANQPEGTFGAQITRPRFRRRARNPHGQAATLSQASLVLGPVCGRVGLLHILGLAAFESGHRGVRTRGIHWNCSPGSGVAHQGNFPPAYGCPEPGKASSEPGIMRRYQRLGC